ncbi:MAG: ATP-binding protein [Saprospiraceae bacterium]
MDKNVAVRLLDQTIEGLSERSSELEEREKSLAATVDQLQLANDDMQHFMHVASHDLKTPLRSIGSFASLIKRRVGDSLGSEIKEHFGYIIRSAKSMNRVIDDLVRFNGVAQNRKTEEVDLDEIAAEVVHNLYADISANMAKVEVKKLGTAMAYRSAVSQLLQNLIRNSIVYRHPDRLPEISVSYMELDSRRVLTVRDNGIGLDNEYQEKAFLPFKRVGDVTKPGTGMGLAICRRIVRKLGGDIWYDGIVGVGTTFYVSFEVPASKPVEVKVIERAA